MKGQYKQHPNHVLPPDGSLHSYAPVLETQMEMQRFVGELNTDGFRTAHPALQAAYAHHAFVWIHPFADGNGRVARALASIFTLRTDSIPLLILLEHKAEYLTALREADRGQRQPVVNFVVSGPWMLRSCWRTA